MAFVCLPYYDDPSLLADDPSITCLTRDWYLSAAIASAAIALGCIGLPAFLFLLLRRWRRGTAGQQQRIGLLLHSYQPSAWLVRAHRPP